MINRENGLNEIYERIKANRIILGIKTFKRNPTRPITEEDLPCIFMLEGVDTVLAHSKRTNTGYPVKRALEVTLELVTQLDTDIKTLYTNVRRVVFTKRDSDPVQYSSVIAQNTFINENRTEGPTGYGLPDVLGMRLVLDLVYTDDIL